MYTHTIKKLPKNTIEINLSIPWNDIQDEYKKAFAVIQKDTSIEGFRKGKAPKDIAEKHINKEDVYQKLLQTYVPTLYSEIVKKEGLKPIISPRLELKSAAENKNWELIIRVAEIPTITLGKYVEAVKAAKKEVAKSSIWVPGKDKEVSKEDLEKQNQAEFQAVLAATLAATTVEVSDLIVEDELNQRLSRMVDDVQKIGLTMEKYLESKKISKDDFKNQIKQEIIETYKMEFVLQKIADEQKIQVEKEELEKIVSSVKDPKERDAIVKNMYYYASLLRKQKTLDYLSSL
ncbi:MAG: trigger factor [bacterium]|nr:trigger factor [bacterium]